MKKVFVTGASGYIGQAVAAAFARAGHHVRGLVRSQEKAQELARLEVEPVQGALEDAASLLAGAADCQVVVHAAVECSPRTFDLDARHVFAGLCAVDTPEHVEGMFAAFARAGLKTTRMGACKPRTSPYDFQGHGRDCLTYVFELAGKYGIKVVAMEIVHETQLDELEDFLADLRAVRRCEDERLVLARAAAHRKKA